MTDRREVFANERVAHVSLRGQVKGLELDEGAARQARQPVADVLRAPDGSRDTQLLFGNLFEVIEIRDGWCLGRCARDGYVGYMAEVALADASKSTHWVKVRSTHIYSAADMKSQEIATLSFGSFLTLTGTGNGFARLLGGGFVPLQHVLNVTENLNDPAEVAFGFLGAPYLWGGNSAFGMDCSGLVQMSLHACGRDCPRDSDQQEAFFTTVVSTYEELQRGDLVFWRGHVGLMLNNAELIHANAHHMAVEIEPFEDARKRIGAKEFGEITAMKRP